MPIDSRKLPCVSSTPLGAAVVPDVKWTSKSVSRVRLRPRPHLRLPVVGPVGVRIGGQVGQLQDVQVVESDLSRVGCVVAIVDRQPAGVGDGRRCARPRRTSCADRPAPVTRPARIAPQYTAGRCGVEGDHVSSRSPSSETRGAQPPGGLQRPPLHLPRRPRHGHPGVQPQGRTCAGRPASVPRRRRGSPRANRSRTRGGRSSWPASVVGTFSRRELTDGPRTSPDPAGLACQSCRERLACISCPTCA